MKHCVPDWKMEDESRPFHDLLPASNQKRYIGQDNDLIELLWENGHVVLHNQTNYRPSVAVVESKQAQKPETLLKWGASVENSRNLIQEDETASWLQSSLDDPLDGEFSEFFCDMLNPDPHVNDKSNEGEKCCVVFSSMEDSDACSKLSTLHPQHGTMLPPKPLAFASAKHLSSLGSGDVLSSSHHRKSRSAEMGAAIRNFGGFASGGETVVRIGESSSMGTMESSICGGSHDQNQVEASHASSNGRAMKDSQVGSAENCRQANAFDPTAASSSGGSGCSLGRVGQESKTTHGHKRKGRDVEESDCHIEDVEQQQIEENKYAQRTPPSRRSRAAEVHNLSERRRRDRINEKMRALQELIPHCNKSDKASMLEEAIEYLKSLQLQVQIMWMGSGMAPMMLPQYMSHMGIGMGHPPLASAPSSVQLSGSILMNDSILPISMPNQQLPFSSPGLNPLNLPNPLPGIHLPAPFSHCLGFFPHMQLPNQVMGMYAYGSQVMHQNHNNTTVDCSPIPAAGAASENIQTG